MYSWRRLVARHGPFRDSAQPILEALVSNSALEQYDTNLRRLVGLRVLQQMERVYLTVKIDAVTSIAYGRQFDHTYPLYSRVTRKSIDALKEFFREECDKDDWNLLVRLKKQYGVI